MDALYAAGEWLAIVIGGLLLRFAAAVAILAALVAVLLPVLYAFEGGRRLLRRLRGVEEVHGFEWRRQPRYASTHLWLGERDTRFIGSRHVSGDLSGTRYHGQRP